MTDVPIAETKVPAAVIWALGVTQVIGYGSLYYSFSVMAPAMASDFGTPPEWIYGALSVALLAGGFIAPWAGSLADRFGAARIMAFGSIAAAMALVLVGLAPEKFSFVGGMVAIELASAFVLYSTAFAALAQIAGKHAQRSITLLTLIAGFASTIFWPLTSLLMHSISWHQTYLVYAALHLLVCLPLHAWIGRFAHRAKAPPASATENTGHAELDAAPAHGNTMFWLMVIAFSVAGFVSSAMQFHLVPLLTTIGFGASGILVSTLVGPSQVLSRLINMAMGKDLPQPALAVLAATFVPVGLVILALSTPNLLGAVVFAMLFGLGNGLSSIVSGTLPLVLFGRAGYGRRLGWISSGRLIVSALAPFAFAISLGALGARTSIWFLAAIGVASVLVFLDIWRRSLSRAGNPVAA